MDTLIWQPGRAAAALAAAAAACPRLITNAFRAASPSVLVIAAAATPAIAQDRTERVERGRYLVETIGVCTHCHTPQRLIDNRQVEQPNMHLAGGYGFDNPVIGRWAGANITPDPETGIGSWSEEQIATAIREGKRPDGSVIGPPMPFAHYRKISDMDAAAMAAYLKSVPPVRNPVERSTYRNPIPADWGPPVSNVAPPSASDAVARGAYLSEVGHCMDCHTPNRVGGGRDWSRVGAGGRPVVGLAGPVLAPNITPHAERGIGKWTDEQVIRAITQGVSIDGRRLSPPMPFDNYARMSRADLADLVAFLRSLQAQP